MTMHPSSFRRMSLPGDEWVPALGLGTWCIGDDASRRAHEVAAVHEGLDLGMRVIDTAEMYGEGASEELVGEAIAGRRDEVFLVSKVLPNHATRRGVVEACERSLRRLRTDRLDLYLLHWRGSVPLGETVAGFRELAAAGKIRHWGVSNFDVEDMAELFAVPGGNEVAVNQVLYNLLNRGIEFDLLPWCRRQGVAVMAYSPLQRGELPRHPVVRSVAARHGASATQVALAWVMRQEGVCAIPKAATPEHVAEDFGALGLALTAEDHDTLDRAFPPPTQAVPLGIL